MQRIDLNYVMADLEGGPVAYAEFLRVPAMSAGLYRVPAGAQDPQTPHTEDEVYLVLQGRATFRAGGERVEAGPGTVLYVPAGEEHAFEQVREDLVALVLFAPAEGTAGA